MTPKQLHENYSQLFKDQKLKNLLFLLNVEIKYVNRQITRVVIIFSEDRPVIQLSSSRTDRMNNWFTFYGLAYIALNRSSYNIRVNIEINHIMGPSNIPEVYDFLYKCWVLDNPRLEEIDKSLSGSFLYSQVSQKYNLPRWFLVSRENEILRNTK